METPFPGRDEIRLELVFPVWFTLHPGPPYPEFVASQVAEKDTLIPDPFIFEPVHSAADFLSHPRR